jgi:alpha-1,3-rhamnosyl/mannosyltransferase
VRVAFDETGLELDATGSARAARCLRDALAAQVELVALAQPDGPGGRYGRGLIRELAWYPFGLPRRALTVRADVLHCPMPLGPPRRVDVPVVLTINDGIPWDHPEWLTRAHALHARLVLIPAARAAARVLVPSEHTRERVLANVRGLAEERVVVAPYGVDPRFTPGPGPSGSPYLLAVGTLQPRKNLEAALRAFERLDTGHRLVVVGARGWRDEELLARVERSPASARIELRGFVADDELLTLYRGADCLLYPSRAEGFGFPPLEAMACGTPVVTTTAGSLPEVTGDAALVVDPDDAAGLADAVRRVLADPAPWRERGLARAAGFSWTRCAELTLGAYRAAVA